ncbi:uncharacterized protein LOC100888091 isoform X1 [Strongylocentrotus purpuratus]|uniref:Uncharacterized protein n=1 Tax=Strongylocentrotus purpuratus TaxID=7668 RepID=A0A7M7GFQ7_STRPU|nr:uncharacterized protein LOC100888091 isoform X1 [Strongylocentrotus purpuratus]
MPTTVVMVRWLQPLRYRGMEETVSRSRVRQRGHLSVGEEVRVRYKRSFYKAEIIDNGEESSTEPTASTIQDDEAIPVEASRTASPPASPLRLQILEEASSPDSPPRIVGIGVPPAPLPYFTPFASTPLVPAPLHHHPINADESASDEVLVFNPVPEFQFPRNSLFGFDDTDDVMLPEERTWELTTLPFGYSNAASVLGTELDSDLDSYDSGADSYDSEDSEGVPSFAPYRLSNAAIEDHAQRMINNRNRSRLSSANPATTSSPGYHECIEEELLDDIIKSAEVSPDHDDSTLTTVQRFHVFLTRNIKRIDEEILPRVTSLAEFMLDDNVPCLRCIVNLTKTTRRLESLRDNLAVFLSVASRTMHTAPEE